MATKSICKNITIKNRSSCRSLIRALENAQKKKAKEVKLSKSCTEIKKDDIESFFGEL